jgi:hypothetical protein
MCASTYAIPRNVRIEPQRSGRRASYFARATEIDRHAPVARGRAGMRDLRLHRSSLSDYAARMYAAVAT